MEHLFNASAGGGAKRSTCAMPLQGVRGKGLRGAMPLQGVKGKGLRGALVQCPCRV